MDEDPKLERWMDTTARLFEAVSLNVFKPHSICIVPGELRQWNERAYEPKVVSIGPRYKGRRDLLPMEKIKWLCATALLTRTKEPETCLKSCMEAMLKEEVQVRASYGEEIKLDSYELATVMVYDGCFVLEVLISQSTKWHLTLRQDNDENDELQRYFTGLGPDVGKIEEVLSDLMLIENQIPLFILKHLFHIAFPEIINVTIEYRAVSDVTLEYLALSLFVYSQSQDSRLDCLPTNYIRDITDNHFLELVHSYVVEENNQPRQYIIPLGVNKQVKLNRCVTRLQAAGIRVKREENSVIPISRTTSPKFQIKFSDGVLQIPTLEITQTTKVRWLNFIAWEHDKKKGKMGYDEGGDVFTFSALLFNDLICCASDAQLLKNKGIIVDHLSMSNHDLVDLFRSITRGVHRGIVDSSDYGNMIDALNTYSATNFVVRLSITLWHSFGQFSEWLLKFLRRGYNFAAALITLLTLVQTFYAVLSYHHPN